MYLKLKSAFFFFLLVSTLISCDKEYSIEGLFTGGGSTGGASVFTLDGAPGACNGASVQGSYKAGTPLTTANNVILTVNVTALGTYTITTNTTNGFSFAGSGTFTQLGFQIIQLNATGTPTNPGNINFRAGAASCSFGVTVTTATGGGGGTSSAVYVFNGNPNTCATPVISGTYMQGTPLNSTDTVVLKANVTVAGTYSITTSNNGMTFTASGTFATTGPNQNVTFRGSGTPTASGNINFSIPPAASGCTFTVPVTANGGGGGANFLKATIGGVLINFNTNLIGKNQSAAAGPSSLSIDGDSSTATTSPSLGISFLNSTGLITTGNYSNFSPTNTVKGILILYSEKGVNYISGFIPSSSSGNIATYTSTSATGTFSGTVYDNNGSGPGNKVITTGSFSISY